MSVLRSALQRRVLNFRILYGIPQCFERQSTFNSFYISRLAHTSAENGESGNTSRSAQKSQPGYTKPNKVIIRDSTSFNSTPSHPTHTYKNRSYFTTTPPEHYRIFVGGLSKFTTEELMRAYFRKFGSVKHCRIDRDEYGISQKRGYVEFEFNAQANRAIESFPHVIDGQEVVVCPYFSNSKKNQIMVRGLPHETSQMTLRNFYSQFGDVTHCKIVRDERNVSRGYAFVSFKSAEAVDLALNCLPHCIDGEEISNIKRTNMDRKRELTFRVFDLSPKTTEESLRKFYSRFGRLTRCELHLTSKTKLRYGNVAFSTQKELDHALDAEPHIIDGSKVFLKYLTSELDLCVQAVPDGIGIESLEKFFSKYGELRDCRFDKTLTGLNNAYVCFTSIDAVNRALADRPHIVEGKVINTLFANRARHATFSLFVGSLPEKVTEKSLFETFSKFGKLVYWEIHNDGKLNPYGCVSYGTTEEALNALNNGPHMMDGVTLDVRKETETTNHRRIFVAGLSKFTTEESMRTYFCKFGTVKHCSIDREPYIGISKKTGYVEFESDDQANLAIEYFSHVIDGQEANVQPYFNSRHHEDFKKYQIIVRGLLQETSQMTLRNFYSQFGEVTRCNISREEGNVSRGSAFVSFKSGEALDLALNSLPHCIDGKEISNVQRAIGDRKRELTLRVFDLSPETTKESLREFYSRFGNLTRCELARNPNTGALQRGIVAFETQEDLDNALKAEPHVIDGSKVFLTYLTSELDLCVKAIPEGLTKKSLEKFFSKYGDLRGFRFEKTRSGNDIAFVHFSTLDAVDRALADRPHIVEGKLVNTTFASKAKQATFSFFVGSLPESATEKSLFETFSKFGKLVHWQLRDDGKLNQSTPYGFVSYGTAEEALTALNSAPHMIEGTTLDVRKAREMVASMKEEESDRKSED
ncbi:RNA recognition motif domain-containing protein [Ditylenchus destructor]|nr:RNA recognition motif domain-containing protein [Ditylenchus destructor]